MKGKKKRSTYFSLFKRVLFQTFSNVWMPPRTRILRSMKFTIIRSVRFGSNRTVFECWLWMNCTFRGLSATEQRQSRAFVSSESTDFQADLNHSFCRDSSSAPPPTIYIWPQKQRKNGAPFSPRNSSESSVRKAPSKYNHFFLSLSLNLS